MDTSQAPSPGRFQYLMSAMSKSEVLWACADLGIPHFEWEHKARLLSKIVRFEWNQWSAGR